jgi:hypothetical protein
MKEATRRHMPHLVTVIALLVVLSALTGCLGSTSLITEDEASAIVYDYLQYRVNDTEDDAERLERQRTLGEARPQFHARFLENGQWLVLALGYHESYTPTGGEWFVYERTKTVEPWNPQARELLLYWQGR